MSREMNGPSMMKQMQEYFKQNPDQHKQFLKIQQNMQEMEEEKKKSQMSPKEKLDIVKCKFKDQRLSKDQKSIIDKKTDDSDAEKEEELKKKEHCAYLKKQRKYAKKKLKKKNSEIEKEFEIVE